MTKNDEFHNTLLKIIAADFDFLESYLLFKPDNILTQKYFNRGVMRNRRVKGLGQTLQTHYEIDIYVESKLKNESAIIEIKSHNGRRSSFTHHQYPIFQKYHPNSQIWLIFPKIPYNLDIRDLHCERFKKIGTGEIEYI